MRAMANPEIALNQRVQGSSPWGLTTLDLGIEGFFNPIFCGQQFFPFTQFAGVSCSLSTPQSSHTCPTLAPQISTHLHTRCTSPVTAVVDTVHHALR